MDPKLRNRLLAAAGVMVALICGWQIAHESFALAGLIIVAVLGFVATRLTGQRIDVLMAGVLLIGYLVGNRGFAQLGVPNLPLLVGELTLGVGAIVALWHSARTKTLPIRRDALNFVLLAWLAFGCVRLRFDVRAHGAVALRDFALLYYAAFFFLAQGWGRDPALRRWLERCLDVAYVVAPPVFLAFVYWPDFFTEHFSLRGIPLIFIKSDVEGGLLVAGVFWLLHRHLNATHSWWLVAATLNLVGVALSNSRAAQVALVATAFWPLACRDWRLLRPLGAMTAAGLALLFVISAASPQPWSKTPVYRLYETAATVIDFEGTRVYETADLGDKPDNNRFRMTWWRTVIDETWRGGPWFGLGFGYNLSEQFIRVYYADSTEEFSSRSPHNFVLTVFGRMGVCGIALLTAMLLALLHRIVRFGRAAVIHGTHRTQFAPALGALAILVSACFGVVLEGPMAAAVFWTMLGFANTPDPSATEPTRPEPLPEAA